MPNHLSPVVRRVIEDAGSLTQSLGVGRVLGQIYAFLYFSREPKTLADFQDALGISKGSASMGVRQLEAWGAVHKVWVKGDRKDYYEADDWFGNILKNAVIDSVGKRLAQSTALLEEIDADLEGGNGDDEFIKDRIAAIRRFQDKAQKVWNSPVVRMLLK